MRHYFVCATIATLTSFSVLFGCASSDAPNRSESATKTGTVRLPLIAVGESGTQYRLSSATFLIKSVAGTSQLNTDDNVGASELSTALFPGDYSVTLSDGWVLEVLDASGNGKSVSAKLLSSVEQNVTVTENASTDIVYQFRVDKEVVTTSPGVLRVRIQVTEGTGGNGGTGGNSGTGGNGEGGTSTVVTSTVVDSCTISSIVFARGEVNPSNSCERCEPTENPTGWTAAANGTSCGSGSICQNGVCVAGCLIGSTYFTNGTVNPDDPCQTCVATQSTSSWSSVPSAQCVQDIALGYWQGCAVVGGSAKCWGYNAYGNLGNNSTSDSLVPVQVQGLTTGVTNISVSFYHSCAIVDGGAQCWGFNASGSLGSNSTVDSKVPVQVTGLTSGARVTHLAVGALVSCAVVSGAVQCWGAGRLGNNSTENSPVPIQTLGLTENASLVAAGSNNGCAVVGGRAYCWGSNDFGQLGNNSSWGSSVPVTVQGLTEGVTSIDIESEHACAVKLGSAYCWGYNSDGQLGNDSTANSLVPVQVKGLTSGVTAVAVGGRHSCAIVSGDVYCWGLGTTGQLGNNSTAASRVPVLVSSLPSGSATAIAAGNMSTCAIVRGRAYCWGYNLDGQLGNNSTTNSLVPSLVSF
jgi:alpha-tubulin suppressor-like RCC1 family protein